MEQHHAKSVELKLVLCHFLEISGRIAQRLDMIGNPRQVMLYDIVLERFFIDSKHGSSVEIEGGKEFMRRGVSEYDCTIVQKGEESMVGDSAKMIDAAALKTEGGRAVEGHAYVRTIEEDSSHFLLGCCGLH